MCILGGGCSTAQAFQVFKIAPIDLDTSGGKRLGGRIGKGSTARSEASIGQQRDQFHEFQHARFDEG